MISERVSVDLVNTERVSGFSILYIRDSLAQDK